MTTTTTTTTTTTLPPRYRVLGKVETVEVLSNGLTQTEQDGSDSKATKNTIDSEALDVGPLAPGETSTTKIIYLRLPVSIGIDNIRIALIDSGGINFNKAKFGVETANYLDYNIIPSTYFQGINTEKRSDSAYNVNIPNNGVLQSQYVYLNVTLPIDQVFGGGTIRYKWFFDYDSGVSSTEGAIDSTGSGTSGIALKQYGLGKSAQAGKNLSIPVYQVSNFTNSEVNGRYYGPITQNPGLSFGFTVGYYKEGASPDSTSGGWMWRGGNTWYLGVNGLQATLNNPPNPTTPTGLWTYEWDSSSQRFVSTNGEVSAI